VVHHLVRSHIVFPNILLLMDTEQLSLLHFSGLHFNMSWLNVPFYSFFLFLSLCSPPPPDVVEEEHMNRRCVYIYIHIYIYTYEHTASITALLLCSAALKKMNLFKQVNFPTEMDQTDSVH